ncbi:MAG: hypothetical protein KUG64_10395 [Cycloclasticus sp.]|nr:hypothetical protein [Cycloclasticus sp.]
MKFAVGDKVEIRNHERSVLRDFLHQHGLTDNIKHACSTNNTIPEWDVLTGTVILVDAGYSNDACPYLVKFDYFKCEKLYMSEFNLVLVGNNRKQLKLEVDV